MPVRTGRKHGRQAEPCAALRPFGWPTVSPRRLPARQEALPCLCLRCSRSCWRDSAPPCGALLRDGTRCDWPPAEDLGKREDLGVSEPVKNGRCERHGAYSSGPRSRTFRAALARRWRAQHEADAIADGKVRPPRQVALRVAGFLRETTWAEATELTGMSVRTLQRLEDGRYCDPEEIRTALAAIAAYEAAIADHDEEHDA